MFACRFNSSEGSQRGLFCPNGVAIRNLLVNIVTTDTFWIYCKSIPESLATSIQDNVVLFKSPRSLQRQVYSCCSQKSLLQSFKDKGCKTLQQRLLRTANLLAGSEE